MSVRLVDLTVPVLESLAENDVTAAEAALGMSIPPDFAAETGKWSFFAASGWPIHAVVHEDTIVGDAGFKGPSDSDGAVEIGYAILESQRRRGYATAAVRLLLERAAAYPRTRLVRAEVGDGNDASVGVLRAAGFRADGERTDPEEGRLLLFTHSLTI
jgi:RimJ/RimL family protein N-acetyltransferase